jgi:hypothetical protein
VATSPEQTLNIPKHKIIFEYESIDVTISKPTGDDLAKNNAFIFIAKNLNKVKQKILKTEITAYMGEKNDLMIFFYNG